MAKQKEVRVHTTWKNAFKRDWQLYLLVLIPLALVIIFNYAAYPGLRMVFMDYKPAKGYAGSKVGGLADLPQDLQGCRLFEVSEEFHCLQPVRSVSRFPDAYRPGVDVKRVKIS